VLLGLVELADGRGGWRELLLGLGLGVEAWGSYFIVLLAAGRS